MTDRELLELAAKAAGIEALRDPNGVLRDCTGGHPAMNIFAAKPWSPLTNNSDAMNLVSTLGLSINVYLKLQQIEVSDYDQVFVTSVFYEGGALPVSPNIIRRAIVQCAASIGRAMPGPAMM